ncbi:MAG: threonine synthase [Sphaerochaetaceae bacterium]
MKFISTRGKSPQLSASEAMLQGLATDGGLYVPTHFPQMNLRHLASCGSYAELAYEVLAPFFVGDELESELAEICTEAFNFPLPLHWHTPHKGVLELFWGPTAAFKDFGARFLASSMERLLKKRNQDLTILVATSGDTGGAVASAFYHKEHLKVKVLFPQGRVSARQQQQLTCWADNVESFAVKGVFDDCQTMVKQAFMDTELQKKVALSSANSINLGRLLPQMVYPFFAALESVRLHQAEPTLIIPSGNVGNSCGSFWAKECGAPIANIVLALNNNTTVADYIASGVYEKRPSVATLANAMDVGDPSNMERLRHLYNNHQSFINEVQAYSVSDQKIIETIQEIYNTYSYIVCPHTATGEYVRSLVQSNTPTIVYATAHPAKFDTIVEPAIGTTVEVPPQLASLLASPSVFKEIEADYRLLF